MKHCYNINIQSDINDGLMVYWRIRALGVENITGCYGETVQRKFIKRSYDNVNVLT
jgi:translation elongation factor EF-4